MWSNSMDLLISLGQNLQHVSLKTKFEVKAVNSNMKKGDHICSTDIVHTVCGAEVELYVW